MTIILTCETTSQPTLRHYIPPGLVKGFALREPSLATLMIKTLWVVSMAKSKYLQIRISDADKKKIQELADESGRTMTELITQAISRVRPWTAADKKVEQARTRELARIGNNLNQISRWANTYKDKAAAVEVIQHLVSIEHELKKALS